MMTTDRIEQLTRRRLQPAKTREPLLHINHTIHGQDTERVFLIAYRVQSYRRKETLRPWGAYTTSISSKRHGDEPTPNTLLSYSEYNFEHCRNEDTTYFYEPGGGGGVPALDKVVFEGDFIWVDYEAIARMKLGPLWTPEGRAEAARNVLTYRHDAVCRLAIAQNITILDHRPILGTESGDSPFESYPGYDSAEGKTIYCSKCNDWLPSDTDNPCKHIRWCDEHSQHTGAGLDKHDRCGCRRRP